MWEAIRSIVTSVKDALGIEIPALPVDVGGIGEAASTAVQGSVDAASGALDGVTAAGEAAAGSLDAATQMATDAPGALADTAGQALDDITGTGTGPR